MAEKITDFLITYNKPVTAALVVLCAVVLYFAIRATVRHNKNFREDEAKIIRMKKLKETFENLSAETIKKAESEDLLEGVALHYQLRIQKHEDIEKAFRELPLCARYIYVLDIFTSEGAVPSEFYKNNGNILRELFVPALEAIGESKLSEIVLPLSRMYDPKDEMASIDNSVIKKADEKFAQAYGSEEFKLKAADYIRSQAENFI